jgi:hypothetical protein
MLGGTHMKTIEENQLVDAFRKMNARDRKIMLAYIRQYLKEKPSAFPALKLVIGGGAITNHRPCHTQDGDPSTLVSSTVQRY